MISICIGCEGIISPKHRLHCIISLLPPPPPVHTFLIAFVCTNYHTLCIVIVNASFVVLFLLLAFSVVSLWLIYIYLIFHLWTQFYCNKQHSRVCSRSRFRPWIKFKLYYKYKLNSLQNVLLFLNIISFLCDPITLIIHSQIIRV